ncbi:hypothetical protein L6R50_26685 [Myxococcota bacterium]|nr:hypothetical protein [Myxococcota bacterium]
MNGYPRAPIYWTVLAALFALGAGCTVTLGDRGRGDDDDDDDGDDDSWSSDDDVSDDDASDDDASDDDASDDDASDDDVSDDDDTSDDDTYHPDDDSYTPSYDEPNSWTYRMIVWPEWSGSTVVRYVGEFTLSYYDTDFGGGGSPDPVCDDLFVFVAEFDDTPGVYDCPSCIGQLQDFGFYDIPLADEDDISGWDSCRFDDPSDWITDDVLNTSDFQGVFSVMVSRTFDYAYPIIDIEGLVDELEAYGLDTTHLGYKDDIVDGDGDGNTTENVPWGIFYADPGTWETDFTLTDHTEEGEVPTSVYAYYFWWIFGI